MEKRSIEEELNRQRHCLFQTVGDSMEPLLHNRKSTIVIEKTSDALKKYDVALFRRPTGEYVLHRVLKVRDKDYLICGDNRTYMEPVPKEWVFGVMTGFYPDESGRLISCEDWEYQRYLQTLDRRYCIRWMKALPGRIRRRLVKMGKFGRH